MTTSIWCVGRNYKAHAAELNNPVPQTPLIFLKSGACLNSTGRIQLPTWTGDIHHECELAVKLGPQGHPTHVALALDLTARSLQSELKKRGEPWTAAKSFAGACPISTFIPLANFSQFEGLKFTLLKNEQPVQSGTPKDMIFDLTTLLSHIKQFYPITEGDVVLTGTPEGVGPLQKGDVLRGSIEGLLDVTWSVI